MAYKNYDMLSLQQKVNEIDNKCEKDYVDEKVNDINSSLEDIALNFNNNYPKLSGETNDFARYKRAIENAPENSTILIPNGTYDMNNADYTITRPNLNIVGQSENGVIFNNIKTVISSSNITTLIFLIVILLIVLLLS